MTKTQKRQHDDHHHWVYWFDCLGGGVDGRAGGLLVVVREDISFSDLLVFLEFGSNSGVVARSLKGVCALYC
jgi:hypothetical protein